MADLLFVGQFVEAKAGATGLTVTVDVDRYTLADASRTALVTGGSATEGRRGLYHYRLASADLATYQYVATFITADTDVDQQEIAALGLVVPDALVGSRLAPTDAGRTLDIAATGEASANVTMQAGEAVAPADANGNVPVVVKAWYDTLVPEPNTAGYPDIGTVNYITEQVSQLVRDAMKLAPSGGAAAAGSVDALLSGIDSNVDAIKLITDDLDVSAVTQVAASSAGHLTITAGLTFSEAVTGLLIPADWEAALWTLKYSAEQADTAAVIQLRAENPAAPLTDGLLRVNGVAPASPITAADGSLTVTQGSGRIDIWLSDELTLLLSRATGLGWDVKFVDADGDSSGRRGTADVVLTETKTVV